MEKKLKPGVISTEVIGAILLMILQNGVAYGLIQQAEVEPLSQAIAALIAASVALISSARVIIELIRSRTALKEKQMNG